MPSIVPALSDLPKLFLIVVALATNAPPAVLLPAGGGVLGALAPPTWAGTRAHSAVTTTAMRWVPPLLRHPQQCPPAFYAASQRLSPSNQNFLAIAVVGHRYPVSDASASLLAPRWFELDELHGCPEFVVSAVSVIVRCPTATTST